MILYERILSDAVEKVLLTHQTHFSQLKSFFPALFQKLHLRLRYLLVESRDFDE